MSAHDHADRSDRACMTEEDLFLAGLVGEYADRRDCGQPPGAHDLLARAAEFGDGATAKLRTVLALYEALLADDPSRSTLRSRCPVGSHRSVPDVLAMSRPPLWGQPVVSLTGCP